MRKIIVYLVIGAAVLLGAYFVYVKIFKSHEVVVSESIRAIPLNAYIIAEIRDAEAINSIISQDSDMWNQLRQLEELNNLRQLFNYLDSLKNKNPLAKRLLDNQSIIVSLHTVGKKKFESLWVLELKTDIKQEDVVNLIKTEMSSVATVMERKYDDVTVYDAKYNQGKRSFCFTVFQQNLIMSYSSMLVEDAVRQLKYSETSILDNPAFIEVYNTAGQKEMANIYIQGKHLPDVLTPLLSSNYKKHITNFSSWATWTELDLNLRDLNLKFNGFSSLNDSLPEFVSVLGSQNSIKLMVEQVLPSGTSIYLSQSLTDLDIFKKKLENWMKSAGCFSEVEELKKRYNNQTGSDIGSVFYDLIDNEFAMAVTQINSLNVFQNGFLIIKTKSKSSAEDQLKEAITGYANRNGESIGNYISQIQIDAGAKYTLYNLPWEKLGYILFGPMYSGLQCNYLVFFDNYMIIGSSKESLSTYIHSLLLNKTLATDIEHNSFKSEFSEKSNMFLYLNTYRAKELLKEWMNKDYITRFDKGFEYWSSLSELGLQVANGDKMMYNYMVIRYTDDFKDEPKTIWASLLDTSICVKPALVKNHVTNDKEIIVQDANNTLYLITQSGRELWKIPIDEPIFGEIYQVDAYKNGKLQYFFTTKNSLHLIDRLGNYVDNFPIPLRSEAVAEAGLFDYDNNLDYRILVACKDKKAYLYDIEGKIVNGWNFEGSEHEALSTPQHFRYNTKDFIVFQDRHKLYVLDRTGDYRAETEAIFNFSTNPVFFEPAHGDNKSRFVCTSNSGSIIYHYLDGNTDSLKLDKFSPKHKFSVYDIDNDGNKEYLIVDDNKLFVYNKNKELVFSREFSSEISFQVYFYKFPRNQIKIGVVCNKAGFIYLLNHDGSIFEGFPLRGVSTFSIGYLSDNTESFNLIVGGKGNLLYNYEVKE
jgi:hypothetical protein